MKKKLRQAFQPDTALLQRVQWWMKVGHRYGSKQHLQLDAEIHLNSHILNIPNASRESYQLFTDLLIFFYQIIAAAH